MFNYFNFNEDKNHLLLLKAIIFLLKLIFLTYKFNMKKKDKQIYSFPLQMKEREIDYNKTMPRYDSHYLINKNQQSERKENRLNINEVY